MSYHDYSEFNQNPVEANSNPLSRMMSAIAFGNSEAPALQSKSFLSYAWKAISTPVSNEPQVKQQRDRFGQSYWQVYDPETNRSASLSSEQEVRQWLEQRYYQHHNL